MDNEKIEVKEPEKAVRTVRKLVLKKKPTFKVSPKAMPAQEQEVKEAKEVVKEAQNLWSKRLNRR